MNEQGPVTKQAMVWALKQASKDLAAGRYDNVKVFLEVSARELENDLQIEYLEMIDEQVLACFPPH